jgi:16S rRNA (adenine1518-N6/adenine1519-N6)-dimethyltransferase
MANNPYLDPQRIRAALNTLGVRPSRDLGQNFLTSSEALAAIVEAARLDAEDTVVEVGPGLGVLTFELVRWVKEVVAIEFDRRLAARLTEELRVPNLRVVVADALRVDPGALLGGAHPYKVVANLPYQITSALLRHFLEATVPADLLVVMVQWEVAERIAAAPPEMSVLAHSVQIYAEPEIVARVPAAAFLPTPQVDSAIVRLTRRSHLLVEVDDVDRFFRVIKAGFLHARKKLSNSLHSGLAATGFRVPKEEALRALTEAGVDPGRRAETLTLQEWAAVYERLKQTDVPTP